MAKETKTFVVICRTCEGWGKSIVEEPLDGYGKQIDRYEIDCEQCNGSGRLVCTTSHETNPMYLNPTETGARR